MPILPYSLPVMVLMALLPFRFRALMDPLASPWQPHWETRLPADEAAASNIPQANLREAKSGGNGRQDTAKLRYDVPVLDPRDIPPTRR